VASPGREFMELHGKPFSLHPPAGESPGHMPREDGRALCAPRQPYVREAVPLRRRSRNRELPDLVPVPARKFKRPSRNGDHGSRARRGQQCRSAEPFSGPCGRRAIAASRNVRLRAAAPSAGCRRIDEIRGAGAAEDGAPTRPAILALDGL
jgi:hypothetical protein